VARHREGALVATIEALLDHSRLVRMRFGGSTQHVWAGLARYGRPIQYAHVTTPLAMWDVWTPMASLPAAFEPPSASFALDWRSIGLMRERGIGFATITLAAGISSTGDPALDQRLPFDEPYRIPATTAAAISHARAEGRRIIAVSTPPRSMASSIRERESRISASGRAAGCGSLTRCFQGRTNLAAATTRYCARFSTTSRWLMWMRRSTPRAIARMSSATPF
jgi:S-adenosylmethionine:tRNA ribosyltransferase-isomerase